MPSGGFIAGLAFLLVSVIVAAVLLKKRSGIVDDGWSSSQTDRTGLLIGAIVCGVVFVSILAALFPWGLSFHVLEQHTGTVSQVEQRYVTSGDNSNVNITKEIVFWLKGENKAYVTDDIRFQALKPGDTVNLRRQEQFNYGGTNTWYATYVSLNPAPKAVTNPAPVK